MLWGVGLTCWRVVDCGVLCLVGWEKRENGRNRNTSRSKQRFRTGGGEGAAHDEVVPPVEAGEGKVRVVRVRIETCEDYVFVFVFVSVPVGVGVTVYLYTVTRSIYLKKRQ